MLLLEICAIIVAVCAIIVTDRTYHLKYDVEFIKKLVGFEVKG